MCISSRAESIINSLHIHAQFGKKCVSGRIKTLSTTLNKNGSTKNVDVCVGDKMEKYIEINE